MSCSFVDGSGRHTMSTHGRRCLVTACMNERITSFDDNEEPDVSGVLLVGSHVPLAQQE